MSALSAAMAPLVLAGLLGWLAGSFLNQAVDRTPLRAISPAEQARCSTLLQPGPSVCFRCWQRIVWYDNVPVFAWLWLRGRCRHCESPIGLRTLLMELATPPLWLALATLHQAAGWHLAHLPPLLGLAGWAQVALLLLLERRQARRGFQALGVASAAALVVGMFAF